MEQKELMQILQQYMAINHGAKSAAGGTEITKRCHCCGDSRDIKSKHMYIGFNKQTSLLVYNCFKCNASGMINHKFFRDMTDYNSNEISMLCTKYNETVLNKPGNRLIRDLENMKFINPRMYVRGDSDSALKLDYINKRLNIDLTYKNACDMKIILNLYDFIKANNITTLSRYPDIVGQIDKHFVGFLSVDNSYINFKRLAPDGIVHPSIDKKYINYNIFNKIDNSQRYYIIPQNINTLDPRPIKIHISEGPFDNLSIYKNVSLNHDHSIYANIGGKSYLSIVKFFIETYGFINIEYHIYPDADIDNYEIEKLAIYLRPFGIPFFMHRNMFPGEKDFGVSPSNIQESIIRL